MKWRVLVLFSMIFATVFAAGCSVESAGQEGEDLASCAEVHEVILWAPRSPLTPITKNLTPNLACTHYYVMLPLDANDKTEFHGNVTTELANVHALGKNFHAVAEFNVSAWRHWIDQSRGTRDWHAAATMFRQRMSAAGFAVASGQSDTWAIQELPSTLVASRGGLDAKAVRAEFAGLMRALYDGGGKAIAKKGGAFRMSHGQAMDGLGQAQIDWVLGIEKNEIEAWLEDDAFWAAASASLRFWSEETYADPHVACEPSTNTAARARSINAYTWHVARLAEEGGAKTAAARGFFHATWTPMMSAAWENDVGYGDTRVSLNAMENHVSTEVYAVDTWFHEHPAYGGSRLGFAWVPDSTDANEVDALGDRIASALNDAWAPGHGPAYACSPSGAFTRCQCAVSSARFVPEWDDVFSRY